MSTWNAFVLLCVIALWAGMLGAVAHLAGGTRSRRHDEAMAASLPDPGPRLSGGR